MDTTTPLIPLFKGSPLQKFGVFNEDFVHLDEKGNEIYETTCPSPLVLFPDSSDEEEEEEEIEEKMEEDNSEGGEEEGKCSEELPALEAPFTPIKQPHSSLSSSSHSSSQKRNIQTSHRTFSSSSSVSSSSSNIFPPLSPLSNSISSYHHQLKPSSVSSSSSSSSSNRQKLIKTRQVFSHTSLLYFSIRLLKLYHNCVFYKLIIFRFLPLYYLTQPSTKHQMTCYKMFISPLFLLSYKPPTLIY